MAVSIERSLISRVIDDNDLSTVLEARINESFFEDDEHRTVWLWLLEHWHRYSRVPSEAALKDNFPAYKLVEVPESIDYYIDQLRDRRKYTIAQSALLEATDALTARDADAALRHFAAAEREAHDEIGSRSSYDELTQDAAARLAMYDDLARNPGRLRGLPTGFAVIDRATRGVQPEQFIVLGGAQKSGKSTIVIHSAIHMNQKANAKVALVSFEMAREQQWARYDSFRANVSYNRLMDGKLTNKETRRLRRAVEDARDCEDFVLVTDISATTTVSGVRAMLQRVEPTVLFIDGVYMMEDERGERAGSEQAMRNVSRDLKRLTQSTKVPIFVTTQALESKMARKTGVTAFSIGYTSAFGQDCDVLLGIEAHQERPHSSLLKVVHSRSGPIAQSEIEIDWDAGQVFEHSVPEDDDDYDEDNPPASSY